VVWTSNTLESVALQAAYSSNTVVWTSNTLESVALQADAALAAGTAAGVTAAGASTAAAAANSLAVTATELATANQATLALHDVRIARAQTSADAASASILLHGSVPFRCRQRFRQYCSAVCRSSPADSL
jgi:hypothetical protein